MKQKELKEIIELHAKWLKGEDGGKKAKLRGADLSDVDLSGVDLRDAFLYSANLSDANLFGANLSGVILYRADLRGANLIGANLIGAKLSDADLRYVNLSGAKNTPFIPLVCPSEGSFVAWKKVEDYLIKLEIPEDAKRSSATTNKCRCDKAKVLAIYNLDGSESELTELTNTNFVETTYKVGEMVYPDSFDEDRWKECSNGIHFFINKQEAINY